jgi:hypothetical protein
MGPVEEVTQDSEAALPVKTLAKVASLENYGKFLEGDTLTDVKLVVDWDRFPGHRGVLVAQSEYFRGLFLSEMQG